MVSGGSPAEGWRVRVRRPDGQVCGAGVLVDEWRVITCAHVVAHALGADESGMPPAGAVKVDFPVLPGSSRLAVVMSGGWVPVSTDGRGDLAVLMLDQPAPDGAEPANLGRFGALDNRTVRTYGHPAGQGDGVWARIRPVGFGGPGNEWVQLDGLAVTGRRVERGFSGAGVLDDEALAVVGLVVAEDREAPNRVAWMLPVERVVQYLTLLAPLVGSRAAAAPPAADEPPPAAAPERRLSPAEQRELVRRLVAVPDMLDRSARDLYVRAVEQELGDNLGWRRQRDDVRDVWAMMYALLDRPGALRVLASIVRSMCGERDEVAALEEYVERSFPDLLLDHRERVELERLLAGVSGAWVGAAYRAAMTPFGSAAMTVGVDLPSVVRHLEGYGRLRGGPPPPLLVFVDDIAHKIGGPSSVALHRWIDAVTDRLVLDRDSVKQLCPAAEARRSEAGRVVLGVQLVPDRVDAERYLMSVWLHDGPDPEVERPLLRDDVARTLEEVGEQLDELLRSVPEHVSFEIDELTIEFILPQRLLGYPVEQLEFDRRVFPRPLGIRYPVVVRSLERLRDRSSHDAWRQKWRWLAEHGHRPDGRAIHCVGQRGDQHPQALYVELGEDRTVCLAMPFPPEEGGDGGTGDELVAGLAAGMPVIVWARQPADPARFCTLVRGTLAADGVRNLPRRALQLRRDAARSADRRAASGFTPAVGVLWDDADRIPGSFRRSVRLHAPVSEGRS